MLHSDGTNHRVCDLLLIASFGAKNSPRIALRVSNDRCLQTNFVGL